MRTRPGALALAVALLAANGCCRRRCDAPCPSGVVAAASPSPEVASPAVPAATSDRAVVARAAAKSVYGAPIRSHSVMFIVDPSTDRRLRWEKDGQMFESTDGGSTWRPTTK